MCTSTFTESQSLARNITYRTRENCFPWENVTLEKKTVFQKLFQLSSNLWLKVADHFVEIWDLYNDCSNFYKIQSFFFILILALHRQLFCRNLLESSIAVFIALIKSHCTVTANGISAVNRAQIFNPVSQSACVVRDVCGFFRSPNNYNYPNISFFEREKAILQHSIILVMYRL